MATLGIDPEVKAAADKGLQDFARANPDFYPTDKNALVLQRFLRGMKQTTAEGEVLQHEPVRYELWRNVDAWVLAFHHCQKAGLLESPPPPESQDQRNLRLALKDRYDGGIGNRDCDPTTVIERQARERKERAATEKKKAEDAVKAAAAKVAADSDLSGVPTVAQILSGEAKPFSELTATEIYSMSSAQCKRYTQNSHGAMIEKENIRVAEKKLRMMNREQENE